MNRLVFLVILASVPLCVVARTESRLHANLLNDYDSMIRPVSRHDRPLQIELSLNYKYVSNVDDDTGLVTVFGWRGMKWTDESLTWAPEGYDNMTSTVVNVDKIWRPDIKLYNGQTKDEDVHAVLHYDGTVHHIVPSTMTARCPSVTSARKVKHDCEFLFGSWVYDSHQIKLKAGRFDLATSVGQPWIASKSKAYKQVHKYECCENTYDDVAFSFQLEHKHE